MNNRLLQNYFDVKINPEEKITFSINDYKTSSDSHSGHEYTKYGSSYFIDSQSKVISEFQQKINDENRKNIKSEINRISSFKRTKYSTCTVATQADLDSGSCYAERKEFKFRNQERPDVESQIIGIDMDLYSDIYASLSDIQHFDLHNTANFANIISNKNEYTKVKVNEYTAYINSQNLNKKTSKMCQNNKFVHTKTNFLNTSPKKDEITNSMLNLGTKFNETMTTNEDTLNPKGSIVKKLNDELPVVISLKNFAQSSFNSTMPTYTSTLTSNEFHSEMTNNPNKQIINLDQSNFNDVLKFDDKIYEAYRNIIISQPIKLEPKEHKSFFKIANNVYMYLDSTILKNPFTYLINGLNKKECLNHTLSTDSLNQSQNKMEENFEIIKNEDSSDIYYRVDNENIYQNDSFNNKNNQINEILI